MKKYIFFALALTIFTFKGLDAQTFVDIELALNNSKIVSDIPFNLDGIQSPAFGIRVEQVLDKNLSVRSGLNFQKRGFNIFEGTDVGVLGIGIPIGVQVKSALNTVNVPIQLKYNFNTGKNISAYTSAGINLSYATNGQVTTRARAILDFSVMETPLNLSSPDYNRLTTDAVLSAGLHYYYGVGRFSLDVSYLHGLNDYTSNDFIVETGLRNRAWTVGIAYGFSF